ncbi:hypothetical protein CRG98_005811 [Punica granatum]|uniref:Uncharacterized protein n=1 Tax=Punica granatum TaxID=22663 RepID=A0A2I0KZC5_PUNGR|nr:hypothetical protein CRG98_005811 [Punica granatum]
MKGGTMSQPPPLTDEVDRDLACWGRWLEDEGRNGGAPLQPPPPPPMRPTETLPVGSVVGG